jgi:glycosyltransferase involved in cell wall biosynthesis
MAESLAILPFPKRSLRQPAKRAALGRFTGPHRKALSIIIPTRNEEDNVEPLLRRLERSASNLAVEVIFVDDSDDATAERIREVGKRVSISTSVIARRPADRLGGLGGAVQAGIRAAAGEWVCVMDGDLQHPPELVPQLLERAMGGRADLVLASRLTDGGDAEALGPVRYLISKSLALIARLSFPRRLRGISDPMTGFFVVRRSAVDCDRLQPKGFKILLEILVRFQELKVAEVPFRFDVRNAGVTKAGFREVLNLAGLMLQLRLGEDLRFLRFLTVGVTGFVVNNLLLALLTELAGLFYLLSAVLATQGSSLWNFGWSARWVFSDRQASGSGIQPLAMFLLVNNAALALRAPMMFVMTTGLGLHYIASNILSIALLAMLRFTIADRWIWASQRVRLHTYDIHGVVGVASDVALPELEKFRADLPSDDVTVRVHVGGAGRRPAERARADQRSTRYHEGLGPLGFGVEIEAGENIEVWASSLLRFSPHVLYTNIVEPILRWTFVSRGYALVHGASVAIGDRAFMVTAQTDTGKTTTMLKMLKGLRSGRFLADDLTLVRPDGKALTYPKPMTISRHTVQAIDARTLSFGERFWLFFQSKVHSRTGRRAAKLMTQMRLPVATINAVTQWLIPPPKYPVERLIPTVEGAVEAQLNGLFVIERGAEGQCNLDHGTAMSILLSNCEDAYGFPPYADIEGFLCSLYGSNLHARERRIVAAAFSDCPAVLLRSRKYAWADRIERMLAAQVAGTDARAPGPVEIGSERVAQPATV